MSGELLLEVRQVGVVRAGRQIVSGISLTVGVGEVVGLVGPNGAGKSTVLRAITGVQDSSGSIVIAGLARERLGRRELARRVAVVQQLPEAPPTMRVGELVLLGRHPHQGWFDWETVADRQLATAAMSRAGCLPLADRLLSTLSGGERRRAFIARGLAQQAPLLLLDEPTANLDAGAAAEIGSLVRELARHGHGVLVVFHDLTLAAATCDRIVLLAEGRVIASGRPDEVITPEQVDRLYGPGVTVLRHPAHDRPIIVPMLQTPPAAGD